MNQSEAQEPNSVIATILLKYSNVEMEEKLSPDIRLFEDLKINSARMVDIVLDVEEAFDVVVTDDDFEKIRTVGDIIVIVDRYYSNG